MTIKTEGLPIYDYLNDIVREAQIVAEQQMNMKNPTIADKIKASTQIKHLVDQGKVSEAKKIADGYKIDFNNRDK